MGDFKESDNLMKELDGYILEKNKIIPESVAEKMVHWDDTLKKWSARFMTGVYTAATSCNIAGASIVAILGSAGSVIASVMLIAVPVAYVVGASVYAASKVLTIKKAASSINMLSTQLKKATKENCMDKRFSGNKMSEIINLLLDGSDKMFSKDNYGRILQLKVQTRFAKLYPQLYNEIANIEDVAKKQDKLYSKFPKQFDNVCNQVFAREMPILEMVFSGNEKGLQSIESYAKYITYNKLIRLQRNVVRDASVKIALNIFTATICIAIAFIFPIGPFIGSGIWLTKLLLDIGFTYYIDSKISIFNGRQFFRNFIYKKDRSNVIRKKFNDCLLECNKQKNEVDIPELEKEVAKKQGDIKLEYDPSSDSVYEIKKVILHTCAFESKMSVSRNENVWEIIDKKINDKVENILSNPKSKNEMEAAIDLAKYFCPSKLKQLLKSEIGKKQMNLSEGVEEQETRQADKVVSALKDAGEIQQQYKVSREVLKVESLLLYPNINKATKHKEAKTEDHARMYAYILWSDLKRLADQCNAKVVPCIGEETGNKEGKTSQNADESVVIPEDSETYKYIQAVKQNMGINYGNEVKKKVINEIVRIRNCQGDKKLLKDEEDKFKKEAQEEFKITKSYLTHGAIDR